MIWVEKNWRVNWTQKDFISRKDRRKNINGNGFVEINKTRQQGEK